MLLIFRVWHLQGDAQQTHLHTEKNRDSRTQFNVAGTLKQNGIVMAWLIGLVLDALNNTLVGEHSLALVLVSYVAIKLQEKLFNRIIWQQMMTVFILILMYQMILFLIQGLIGEQPTTILYWMPSVITDRKSTRLNSSHIQKSRMPSSA